MRIRLAEKIVSDLRSGNFDIAITWSLSGPDIQYPISKDVMTRAEDPNRTYFGYNYDELDSIAKGSWAVISATKHGFFWNRRKWVDVRKFDGIRWIYPKLPQHEMDEIYDAWHKFVPDAIVRDDIARHEFTARIVDDGGGWYP